MRTCALCGRAYRAPRPHGRPRGRARLRTRPRAPADAFADVISLVCCCIVFYNTGRADVRADVRARVRTPQTPAAVRLPPEGQTPFGAASATLRPCRRQCISSQVSAHGAVPTPMPPSDMGSPAWFPPPPPTTSFPFVRRIFCPCARLLLAPLSLTSLDRTSFTRSRACFLELYFLARFPFRSIFFPSKFLYLFPII